jgi:hypothetical protein
MWQGTYACRTPPGSSNSPRRRQKSHPQSAVFEHRRTPCRSEPGEAVRCTPISSNDLLVNPNLLGRRQQLSEGEARTPQSTLAASVLRSNPKHPGKNGFGEALVPTKFSVRAGRGGPVFTYENQLAHRSTSLWPAATIKIEFYGIGRSMPARHQIGADPDDLTPETRRSGWHHPASPQAGLNPIQGCRR